MTHEIFRNRVQPVSRDHRYQTTYASLAAPYENNGDVYEHHRTRHPVPEDYTSEYLWVNAGMMYIENNKKAKGELGFNPRTLQRRINRDHTLRNAFTEDEYKIEPGNTLGQVKCSLWAKASCYEWYKP